MTRWSVSRAFAALTLVFVAACTPALTPAPSGSATASQAPSASALPTSATSPEAAAAIVLALDPRFAGIGPKDPNVIGACCSWSAVPSGDGFRVQVEIGWGDCPSGCINRHHWTYDVTRTGKATLIQEDGPPVPPGVTGKGGGDGGTGVIGIRGIATGGPVCPVVRPDDPACADRPVAGALVHVLDATGLEVAALETDANGAFLVTLPAGHYRVQADAVEGPMRPPAAVEVDVNAALELVELRYDTGIR